MTMIKMPATSGRLPLLLVVVAAGVLSAGCDAFGGDCTSVLKFGIRLEVLDDRTNRVPSVPSVITVTDDSFVEVYPRAGQEAVVLSLYGFALGRSGTYSVRIDTPGYRRWERHGVKVSGGRCGVEPTDLTARLRAG